MSELLDELATNRAAIMAAIAGLDEAQLEQKNVFGSWSIKNFLAHLAGWEEWAIQVMQEAFPTGSMPQRLTVPFTGGFDAWNASQLTEREELTPDEQIVELERLRSAFLELVRPLDAATLASEVPWRPGSGETLADFVRIWAHHDAEHLDDLRKAVAQMR